MINENWLLHTLRRTRASGRMALCGYFLSGYPTPDDFYRLVRAASDLDVIEFGIPSSNPAMDGPVIATAHEMVVQQRGIGAETALQSRAGVRADAGNLPGCRRGATMRSALRAVEIADL